MRDSDEPPRKAKKPPSLPFLGSMPWMLADPLNFLTRAARDYGHVVDLGYLGRQHQYLVAHPNGIKHILQSNARNYVKGSGFEAMKLVTGEGLATSEGARWRQQRRMLQPAFHRQKIASITASMVDVALETSARMAQRSRHEAIDFSVEMTHATRTVLMRVLLGIETAEHIDELARAWDVAFETLTFRLLFPVQYPIEWPTPGNIRFRRARGILDRIAYDIIRTKRSASSDANHTNDLLDLLLNARDEETGAGLSNEELRDEIMTFFAGGFETSAMALAWVFHVLTQYPDVKRKVVAELDDVLGGRPPTADNLGDLKYSKMVIEETMRLYPGAWMFVRENVDADVIEGIPIEAGSRIIVSPYTTHRLPEFWTNPEVFDPGRFAPDASKSRPRFAYFPFGGGPRQCIGDIFTMTETLVIMAVLLQRHTITPTPGFVVKPRVMATLRPHRGPMLHVASRSMN